MKKRGGHNRRRNVLSNPHPQLRIIAFLLALGLIYAAINVYISKSVLRAMTLDVLALPMPLSSFRDVQILALEHEAALDLQLAVFTFLSFCMLGLAGILLSHRIGGPMTHLRQYIEGLTDGTEKPAPVRLRKHDFFDDVVQAFNRFQEKQGLLDGTADTVPGPESSPEAD